MNPLRVACLASALLGVILAGCGAHNPLDVLAVPLPPVNGNLTVTTLNGTTVAASTGVYLVDPSGAGVTKTTNPAGQAVFPVTKQGNYMIGLSVQPTTSPYYQKVPISSSQPSANVTLQVSGAYLSVTAADSNPQSFPGYQSSHSYRVTYVNASAFQQDIALTVDTSNFPLGWYPAIQNVFLHAGQSTIVQIYNGQFTGAASVNIPFNALVGSTNIASTSIALTKNWTFTMTRCYDFSYNYTGAPCFGGGATSHLVQANYSFSGTNYTTAPGTLQVPVTIVSYVIGAAAGCNNNLMSIPGFFSVTDGATSNPIFGTSHDSGNTASNYITVNGYYVLGGLQYPFTDTATCAAGAWYNWECL
jgi:hypothetical protein